MSVRGACALSLMGLIGGCVGPDSPGRLPGAQDASVPAADGGRAGWRLVWRDEFDGPEGAPPSPARWTPEVGGDGWGNAQLEHNTDRVENAALDGAGHLRITARREQYRGNAYTSARLVTRGKLERTYGRFEARLKLPAGQGMWPAFWLLGANFGEVGWPACGELDVMEFRGQDVSTVIGSAHGPGYSGGQAVTRAQPISRTDLSADFHVYAIEWGPDRVRWFIDDLQFHEITPDSLPRGQRWVFDRDFFMLLNLAVGGTFVGPVGPGVEFPQSLVADYVRVYAVESP